MRKPPKPFKKRVIASPEDYVPSSNKCRVIGSFNPGAVLIKNNKGNLETLLMVRIAESQKNLESKYKETVLLPYFEIPNKENEKLEMRFDEVLREDILHEGQKEVSFKDGSTRLKYISSQRLLRVDERENIIERRQKPAICPAFEYERFGIEDVRITSFEDSADKKFILTYVSPHRDFGVSTSFLTTVDFKSYKRLPKGNTPRPVVTGIKDVIVFPEKVPNPSETENVSKGENVYAAFTRPSAFPNICKPGIWVSYSPDLIHWGQSHRLTISKKGEVTGSGTPPIKLKNKWVAAYHETTRNEKEEAIYKTRLMSLNFLEPWKDFRESDVLLERKDYLDLLPEDGYVPNVVFTSGITFNDGIITLYSGIDDKWSVTGEFYGEDIEKFLEL